MWWRFVTFCLLVSITLFVVLSCIHGRPAVHLFFHRCCEEDIENDQVIFENFGNNFLRERLVGGDGIIITEDNEGLVSDDDVKEVIKDMRDKFNVHDPRSRINVTVISITDNYRGSEITEENDTMRNGSTNSSNKEGSGISVLNDRFIGNDLHINVDKSNGTNLDVTETSNITTEETDVTVMAIETLNNVKNENRTVFGEQSNPSKDIRHTSVTVTENNDETPEILEEKDSVFPEMKKFEMQEEFDMTATDSDNVNFSKETNDNAETDSSDSELNKDSREVTTENVRNYTVNVRHKLLKR